MRNRLLGWWRFADAVASRLAQPRIDAAGADAAAADLIRASRLFRTLDAWPAVIDRAWRVARSRRAFEKVVQPWRGRPLAEAIRQAAGCVFIAAVTVLLLQNGARLLDQTRGASRGPAALSGTNGPLLWVLPLTCAVAAIIAAAAAESITRAWNAKRER